MEIPMAQDAILTGVQPKTMTDRIDTMFAQDRTWAMALVTFIGVSTSGTEIGLPPAYGIAAPGV